MILLKGKNILVGEGVKKKKMSRQQMRMVREK